MKKYYLTIENLKVISDELSVEFNISSIDINSLSIQNANISGTLDEFVGRLKKNIEKSILSIKTHGKKIIDDLTMQIVGEYNYLMDFLKENSKEFLEKVELLILRWIDKIYEFLIKTIPLKIKSNEKNLALAEVSFERSYGIKAGIKAQITELFDLVAKSNIKIITSYKVI